MAWYNGTFSCGHEGRVNIIGKMSERQWKIDKYFSGVCEECKKKEREEALYYTPLEYISQYFLLFPQHKKRTHVCVLFFMLPSVHLFNNVFQLTDSRLMQDLNYLANIF